ncbi:MAG: DUF362 domain-containing protein [Candidatus Abyssobacteria bacterium SURF_17]|uniref:DUF362 domain-containing protein n=1 Tax=Candidatus Abyssobacteria bacterium SURF_17 TaxID=2093361 RepID=A0A419EVW2_9BACT|nr:MAG: DUF362 domain-containing protein [Candidatus Abyssubacteria bacterium SURF_17]
MRPTDKVILKPNVVTSGAGFMPPFGTVTTTQVIEGMLRALKDFGVHDITIGEGTVTDELGTNTMKGYKWIHLDKLAKRYGVKMVDFNAGPHRRVMSEDVPINIAEAALETDFFINLPVLKTHGDTRVSLASKNLKGCMSMASKKFFHGPAGILHYRISRLMEVIPQRLVVIDGIYAMERGPEATTGTARRFGVLAASTDFLAADAVGARLLGAKPTEAEHLKLYAERNGRMDTLEDPDAIEVCGDRVEDHAKYLEWEYDFRVDLEASGHTGLEIRRLTQTSCSGCGANLRGPLLLLIALSRSKDFNALRIVQGKSLKDDRDSPRTLLFGNCAIKENMHLTRATRLEGCPPKFFDSLRFLSKQMTSPVGRVAFYVRLAAYFVKATLGIGLLPLPRFAIYRKNPDFDIRHFTV